MGRSVLGSRSSHTQKNLHKSIYKSTQLNPQKKNKLKMVEEVIVTPVVEEQLETVEIEQGEEAVAPQPDAGKRRKRKAKKNKRKGKRKAAKKSKKKRSAK